MLYSKYLYRKGALSEAGKWAILQNKQTIVAKSSRD